MILKFLYLLVVDVGLLVISFLIFIISSLVFAHAATNGESPTIETIICCLLALIHTGINIFFIPRRSELPTIYSWINAVIILCIYLFYTFWPFMV